MALLRVEAIILKIAAVVGGLPILKSLIIQDYLHHQRRLKFEETMTLLPWLLLQWLEPYKLVIINAGFILKFAFTGGSRTTTGQSLD